MLKFILILALVASGSAAARDFALTSPDVYQSVAALNQDLSAPTFSPDSAQVLFDRQANLPFTPDQIQTLDSLGAELLDESAARELVASWQGGGQ